VASFGEAKLLVSRFLWTDISACEDERPPFEFAVFSF
jgi:hypothetical protein